MTICKALLINNWLANTVLFIVYLQWLVPLSLCCCLNFVICALLFYRTCSCTCFFRCGMPFVVCYTVFTFRKVCSVTGCSSLHCWQVQTIMHALLIYAIRIVRESIVTNSWIFDDFVLSSKARVAFESWSSEAVAFASAVSKKYIAADEMFIFPAQ